MAYTKIATTDNIIAARYPKRADIKNRAGKELQALIEIAHNSDGRHDAFESAMFGELGTFTGDGTTGKTVALTDTKLTPKIVSAWEIPQYVSAYGTEVVANGAFTTDIASWSFPYGDSDWVNEGITNGACRMWQGGGNPELYGKQTLTTVVGTQYLISVWVKTRAGSSDKVFYVHVEPSGGVKISVISGTTSATWTNYTYIYTATYTGTHLYFGIDYAGTTNYILWDDISVLPLNQITTELVTNGTFDTTTTGWTAINGTIASISGYCRLTNDTTNLITNPSFESDMTGWTLTEDGGTIVGGEGGGQAGNCCKITRTSSAELMALQTVTIPKVIGATAYTLTGYVKTGTGATGALIAFNSTWDNFDATGSWAQESPISGMGQHYYEDSSADVMFAYNNVSVNGTMYFDSFALYAAGAISQAIPTVVGCSYTFSAQIKAGSAAETNCLVYAGNTTVVTPVITGSAWTTVTGTFTATTASTTLYIVKGTNNLGTLLIDTVSVREAPHRYPVATGEAVATGRDDGTTSPVVSNFQEGSFDVSYQAGQNVNSLNKTNYYLALGTHLSDTYTGDPGAGSDPDWVEDAEQMLGGGAGTEPGNKVANAIYAAFTHEHAAAGAHTTALFAGFMKAETGDFQATGITQTITLETPIDIQEIYFWKSTTGGFRSATESMTQPASKLETQAAFETNIIYTVGTGSFTVNLTAGVTYHYVAIGI
jgi:hypothetical protein